MQNVDKVLSEPDKVKLLIASIAASPIGTVITDSRQDNNPIIAVNDAFLQTTGYSVEEVIGRNWGFLAGPSSEPEVRATVQKAVVESRPVVVELWHYRKDGSTFRNAVMIAPVHDEGVETGFFIGTQMEVHIHSRHGFGTRPARRRVLALTPKQRQVLRFMTNGYSDSQIGERLGIGNSAVKRLRSRLLDKLGVAATADAIRIGVQSGMASRNEDFSAEA